MSIICVSPDCCSKPPLTLALRNSACRLARRVNTRKSLGLALQSPFLPLSLPQIIVRCGPIPLASVRSVTIRLWSALRSTYGVSLSTLPENKVVEVGLQPHPCTTLHSSRAAISEAGIRPHTCLRRVKRTACSAALPVIFPT